MSDLIAGDDWELRFTLTAADGLPFDLSGTPQTLWTIADLAGNRVIAANETTIAITDAPNGKLSVKIGSNVSTRLLTEVYNHALRIVSGGITSTPYTGQLSIKADPWATATTRRVRETQVVNLGRPTVVPKHNVM